MRQENIQTVLSAVQTKVRSDVVGSRDVSGQEVLDLRDVHGLFDGGVSAADLKEAALQRVLTDHHSEKHPHLIVPKIQQTQTHQSTARGSLLRYLSLFPLKVDFTLR